MICKDCMGEDAGKVERMKCSGIVGRRRPICKDWGRKINVIVKKA